MSKKTCTFFLSAKGCQYGDKCRNLHTRPNATSATTRQAEPIVTATPENITAGPTTSEELLDPIPDDYLCPISREAMEYPYTTAQGNTYEYGEISRWLRNHDTDPKSGVKMSSKALVPNNILRSQIIEWFEIRQITRKLVALKPPEQSEAPTQQNSELNKILFYKGSKTVGGKKGGQLPPPQSFPEYRQTYTFSKATGAAGSLQVSCGSGESIIAPDSNLFLTDQGIVFYDSTEILDTKVIPGIDDSIPLCTFRNGCKKGECKFSHPFVCALGVTCASLTGGPSCKFYHPSADSVVPLGDSGFLKRACKYGSECSAKQCGFAHPLGRFSHKRENAQVLITHSHQLQKLERPIPLQLDIPDAAKSFQFQGDFVFFFVPYPGTWAVKHYQKVIVHRFDKESQRHVFLGEYSLENHYCNCVAGAGKYFVISFWPFEEEAVRTIWDCLKVARSLEKNCRNKEKEWKAELAKKDQEIHEMGEKILILSQKLSAAELELAKQKKKARAAKEREKMRLKIEKQRREAREAAARMKREQFLAEQRLRQERYERQRQMNERLRMRDPIHIYQLSSGNGTQKSDWTLVVDYHKGAHDIKLDFDRQSECHSLEITENKNVFLFDLLLPDLTSFSSALPIVPSLEEGLCSGF